MILNINNDNDNIDENRNVNQKDFETNKSIENHPQYRIINPQITNENNQQEQINQLLAQNAILKNEIRKRDEQKQHIIQQKNKSRFKPPKFKHGPRQRPQLNQNQQYLNYIQKKLDGLVQIHQLQVTMDYKNDNNPFQENINDLNDIISQPDNRNKPELIKNIRSTLVQNENNYDHQQLVKLTQDEIDNYFNNNEDDIFNRSYQQFELPDFIATQQYISKYQI